MGSLGKINWESFSGNSLWELANPTPALWPSFLNANGIYPDKQPHGDVLGYTMSGVGDVDGDGTGDFALTWYDAEKARVSYNPSGYLGPMNNGSDRIGFVRVISGTKDWSWVSDPDIHDFDTYNQIAFGNQDRVRNIGEEFWGKSEGGLWSHEIFSIGDLDGDGRTEVILSADSADTGGGFLEIWSWSENYYPEEYAGGIESRWVKLIEINGTNNLVDPDGLGINKHTRLEQFGYKAYQGPIPDTASPHASTGAQDSVFNGGLDFNKDGQPDLIIASRYYRDFEEGHFVGDASDSAGSTSPGCVWIFLMPTKAVFQELDGIQDLGCDTKSNWTGDNNSDDIIDVLPLKYSSDDYSVKIIGSQISRDEDDVVPPSNFPRWFGYEVDPAGDLDGDDLMDLAISAPYHMDPDNYSPAIQPVILRG